MGFRVLLEMFTVALHRGSLVKGVRVRGYICRALSGFNVALSGFSDSVGLSEFKPLGLGALKLVLGTCIKT